MWAPPLQLLGKNISVKPAVEAQRTAALVLTLPHLRWLTHPARKTSTRHAALRCPTRKRMPLLLPPFRPPSPAPRSCIFWNAEYNAGAALPTLFRVFLRDTQKARAPHSIQPPARLLVFAACCSGRRQPPYQQCSTARAVLLRSRDQASSCVALHCSSSPAVWLMHACSAFSSPDIAAVGEVGAVRPSGVT